MNLSLHYNWKKKKRLNNVFTPVNLNYLSAELGNNIQAQIANNKQLANSLQDQWILGSAYQFNYTNQRGKRDHGFWLLNGALDVAGNSLYLLNQMSPNSIFDSIAGVPYSQFVRLQGDVRRYINFSNNKALVFRLNMGVGKAYLHSDVLPYVEQFYIGGANSIRAWRLRTLGPGSYADPDAENAEVILDQTGELKLEWNSEYRFPLSKTMRGAFFLDMGNIWNLNVDVTRPGAEFVLNNLYNDLAIGTGFGARWDFSYFIIRLDLGVKLKDPRFIPEEQWVFKNDDAWRTEHSNYDYTLLNLAIGYPF
jgi:outer membrane protein assembly factor BamA